MLTQRDATACSRCGHFGAVHPADALACLICTCSHFEPGEAESLEPSGLWSIERVADHWGVATSRARAILAEAGVKSGYDPDQVRAIPRNPGQGNRTDLKGQPE